MLFVKSIVENKEISEILQTIHIFECPNILLI
jgi:hypothetical protein